MTRPERVNRNIDWAVVEQDYRSGSLSLRQMAAKHDCSHSAISNFASRHRWPPHRVVNAVAQHDNGARA